MTESASKRKARRRMMIEALIGLSVLAAFILAAWYFTSPRFHNYVRLRLVDRLEEISGGKVEIGSLNWNLSKLEIDVKGLTIHGLEPPGQAPYAHADRVYLRLKITSLLSREVGLRYLEVERPVFHLIINPDGSTNQPVPKAAQKNRFLPVQPLFALAANKIVLGDGELIINERHIPLQLTAEDVDAGMSYVSSSNRYDGDLRLGRLDSRYGKLAPAAATARVQFSLFPNHLQLSSVRLTSRDSSLEASGRVDNFARPEVRVDYRAHLNAVLVAEAAGWRRLRAGTIDLSGNAIYARSRYSSSGQVGVSGLDYGFAGGRAPSINGQADFTVDNTQLRLRKLVARVLNGSVRGSVDVHNWASVPAQPRATLSGKRWGAPLQTGEAHLQLEDVPVAAFAEAFSTPSLPLSRLRFAGGASGTVDARWRGRPSAAVARVKLAITPAGIKPGAIPVSGEVLATADLGRQSVRVDQLQLNTPALKLNASGNLGAEAENLRIALSVRDLGELQPMFAALNRPPKALAGLSGQASFNGTVTGRLLDPLITGHIQASDLAVPVRSATAIRAWPTAPVPGAGRSMRVDALSADIQYSSRGLLLRNGTARRGQAQARFDLSAGLSQGTLTDESPLSGHLFIRSADVGELQEFAGLNYPLTGTLDQTLQIGGTKGNPQGSGHVQITRGSIYGEPVQSLAGDVFFANHEARASNVLLVHNGAQASGSAIYNLDTTAFRFRVNGKNFALANLKRLQTDKMKIGGVLNFTASGSGTRNAPVVNADVRVQNLLMNGERVGDLSIDAVTSGDDLRLRARSNLPNAQLAADGSVHLRDDFPAHLKLDFSHLDIDPLLRMYVAGRITGHSSIAGTITASGPLKQWKLFNVIADVPQLSAEIEGVRIRNDGPIRASLVNQTARIERLRLVSEDTQVSASGTAGLDGPRALNLRADGQLNLKLIEAIRPSVHASGLATFSLSVGGGIANPTLAGQVRIADGTIALIDFPNGLSDIKGTLVFNQDRVQIQSLTGKTGGGDVALAGFATFGRTIGFNLTATGRDIRLRYPQGVSSTVNTDLRLQGTLQSATLAGDVTVTRFGVSPQFDLALYLARSNRPAELPSPTSPLARLNLDIHVLSTPELQLQTSQARLAGDVDLQLRGTATKPAILGRINITEGQVAFNGNTYQLERGDITFINPVRTEPIIDVEANTRVRDYEITLGFHGTANRLSTTYRSDPPLPTADIVNLLAFRKTREESEMASTQTSPTLSENVSNAILGQAINTAITGRVQRFFGVSRLNITPDIGGGTQTNPSAQVTIEQQVSNDVSITYITNVTQPSQQSILLEYNINKNMSILASRDQYGILSFDVRIRQRKR